MIRDRLTGGRWPARAPAFAEPLEPRRLFAAGALDPSFSGDGKVTTSVGRSRDEVGASFTRSDGKTVVVGTTFEQNAVASQLAVVRLNANGTPDAGFGTDGTGRVVLSTPHGSPIRDNFRVTADGAGRTYVLYATANGAGVVRLTAAGTPDASFDGDGWLEVSPLFERVQGLALQAGKVIVAGTWRTPDFNELRVQVARYNANGAIDATFAGGTGAATHPLDSATADIAQDVLVRPDGSLAVVLARGVFTGNTRIGLWLLTANGATTNTSVLDAPGSQVGTDIVGGPGGTMFVAGTHNAGGTAKPDYAAVKFDAAGEVVMSYGGGDGVATVSFDDTSIENARDAAVTPDGRLLMAGFAVPQRFTVIRLTPAGLVDPTFSGDGRSVIDVGGNSATAFGLSRLGDGDLVVAGTNYTSAGDDDFAVARLNADGSLDAGYGTAGLVHVDFEATDAAAADVVVTGDGKVVTVGSVVDADGRGDFAVTRHTAAGNLDLNFYDFVLSRGRNELDFGGDDRATAVDVAPDGRIVVAGYSTLAGQKARFAIARYTPDGRLDNTFGFEVTDEDGNTFRSGYRTVSFGSTFNARAWDVKVLANGKILVTGGAGNASSNVAGDFAIAKLNVDSTLDASFSGDGLQRMSFGSNLSTVARGIKVQPNGRIVLAGWAGGNAAVARLTANGTLDGSFSGDGKLTTDFGSSTDRFYGVDLDAAGKVVVAGSAGNQIVLARYSAAGVLDASFDGDGKRYSFAGRAHGVRIQQSGKIVVAGTNVADGGTAFRVARYNTNCSADASFGGGDGLVETTFAGQAPRAANALAFAPGGKLVVAGLATAADGNEDFALARYSIV